MRPCGGFSSLFVDLYELTMAQAYFFEGLEGEAVFSVFVRRLPENRNFLISCGLEQVLCFLEGACFSSEEIDYLYGLGLFKDEFLDWLRSFSFTGDVYALPEGTVFFENEPVLEVVAPVAQAQLLETYILNQLQFQILIATKGARITLSSRDRKVVDFGCRRAHGTDAGIKAARAFYVGGVQATSNVLAGKIYNIPVTGTMAHSYIQVHGKELEAFKRFSSLYPETILLIDTYSIEEGVRRVIELANILGKDFKVRGVRIDSSDLTEVSRMVRKMLDEAGLYQLKIFVSGGLDEYSIAEIVSNNVPIDGFGIGTKSIVSSDCPYLDIVYKLVQYEGMGKLKTSAEKTTIPFQKQVFRYVEDGLYTHDVLAIHSEILPGNPLIKPVMRGGKRLSPPEELSLIRDRCQEEIKRLPPHLLSLSKSKEPYPVRLSKVLEESFNQMRQLN